MADFFNYSFKLFVVGDSGVGKTCLALTFCQVEIQKQWLGPSSGFDILARAVEIDLMKLKLEVWDTAGRPQFRAMTLSQSRNAQGIMMVYDITNRQSFHNIRRWKLDVGESKPKDAVVMLVGNKCDLKDPRQVSIEEGHQLAEEVGIKFFETSSEKESVTIEQAFVTLAQAVKEIVESS